MEQEVWDRIVKDCVELKRNMPQRKESEGSFYSMDLLVLGDSSGDKLPIFNRNIIHFNGMDELGHESFALKRKGSNGFEFCKTARKPYDLMVCACLITYYFHSSDTIKISSDGDREDWQEAYDFVSRVLGAEYVVKFELEGGIGG